MFFVILLASVFIVIIYTGIDGRLVIQMYESYKRNDEKAAGKIALIYMLLTGFLVHVFYVYLTAIFNLKL